ncbi:MAG: SpoIIE family protein phosphatase [Bryobacteraceae bacterium]
MLEDAAILKSILQNIAAGVVVCDASGNLLCFNAEAERILGKPAQHVGPEQWSAVYGCYLPDKVTPFPPEQYPLARAIRGEQVTGELVFIRRAGQQGLWISVSGKPFCDESGVIRGAVAVFRDVTEAQDLLRAQGAGRPPAEDGPVLLDYFENLRGHYLRLCRAVEQTADSVIITNRRGVIEYVNPAFEATTGYSAVEALGRTPSLLKSGLHDHRFYGALWSQVLSGKPYRGTIINRKKDGELYWAEQTITPMRDETGAIAHFVSVLKDVTGQRARQEQEFQLGIARDIQQRLYRDPPAVPGCDLGACANPADSTGGDYFDFIPLSPGRLLISIGDVSGHGFSAALIMFALRAYIRAYAELEPDPGALLARLNRALLADLGGRHYATVMLVWLDLERRSMQYAGAGHVPGYLFAGGELAASLESTGPPLGVVAAAQYAASGPLPLPRRYTVLLLTDGVLECTGAADVPFGTDAVLEHVRRNPEASADQLASGICGAADGFRDGHPQMDDVTAVVCREAP